MSNGNSDVEEDQILDSEGNNELIREVKAGNDAAVEELVLLRHNLNHQNIRGVTVSTTHQLSF
jgi:hypothetical protein